MKNLLIYINPRKDFDEEGKVAIKIQIDNSLDLGWKKEDILLVTNFQYYYNGISSLVVSDDNFCSSDPLSTKTSAIAVLCDQNLIKKGETYWAHDVDAFQNGSIAESELELGTAEIGITDKGRMPVWNLGSIFFKSTAGDIFNWIKDAVVKFDTDEENALWALCGNDILDQAGAVSIKGLTPRDIPGLKNINQRIKKINISYNFRMWNIRSTIRMAVKPIRVVHFHPFQKDKLDFYMYGKNKINTVLMLERLIKIFNKHGIS